MAVSGKDPIPTYHLCRFDLLSLYAIRNKSILISIISCAYGLGWRTGMARDQPMSGSTCETKCESTNKMIAYIFSDISYFRFIGSSTRLDQVHT